MINILKIKIKKANGQLVMFGFDVTTFTPTSYQRPHLERRLKEISSWDWLGA